MTDNHLAEIDPARPRLLGLAYRILGSFADAEDVVQETIIKWLAADRSSIRSPQAWLTTVCTRHCLDILKSAQNTRLDYVGTWLPEPVATQSAETAEEAAVLASTLSTAFLLMLDRLTPKERAAFLLYELFDTPYGDISGALGVSEAACRKLVSRARANIGSKQQRFVPTATAQQNLLEAFQLAVQTGDSGSLQALLTEDVALGADGGGKVIAVPRILTGKRQTLRFISITLKKAWSQEEVRPVQLNGNPALLYLREGVVTAAVSFACNQNGQGTNIYIVRNPEKLSKIMSAPIELE